MGLEKKKTFSQLWRNNIFIYTAKIKENIQQKIALHKSINLYICSLCALILYMIILSMLIDFMVFKMYTLRAQKYIYLSLLRGTFTLKWHTYIFLELDSQNCKFIQKLGALKMDFGV